MKFKVKVRYLTYIIVAGLMLVSPITFAAGLIKGVNFSGPDDPSHSNIVQIHIEGGYDIAGCDVRFAAIRNTEDRKHLISFALAAFVSKTPVVVSLNTSDKYYADRCTISRLSSDY
jgi:hypothetical protein